jgi:hypothetical protein
MKMDNYVSKFLHHHRTKAAIWECATIQVNIKISQGGSALMEDGCIVMRNDFIKYWLSMNGMVVSLFG